MYVSELLSLSQAASLGQRRDTTCISKMQKSKPKADLCHALWHLLSALQTPMLSLSKSGASPAVQHGQVQHQMYAGMRCRPAVPTAKQMGVHVEGLHTYA